MSDFFQSTKSSLCGVAALFLVLASCGGTTTSSTSSDSSSTTSSDADSAPTSEDATTVESGETGIFASLSSSSSDTVNVGGESITIEEGTAYIYRYLVDADTADRFDNTLDQTNSFSCDSAGDQKAYTQGQDFYNIEVCPDIDDGYSTVGIEQINPETGEVETSDCQISAAGTSPLSINVVFIGTNLYYRNSDGDFVKRSLTGCGSDTTLLSSGDEENTGFTDFFNVNDTLVSVLDDSTNSEFEIKSRSTTTGAITATLTTVDYDPDLGYLFYAGDDALYWYAYDSDTLDFTVYRYALSGSPAMIYSATLSDNLVGVAAIDASGGKVLIAYEYVASRDSQGFATSYTTVGKLYNVASGSSTTVSLNEFFENYMQVMVFE